ncbi:hypothetical protein EVAR_103046_1 [Eumeta japonica]|uniref:Uncharacterized protein n=1 Tax=Eumeta variegata TaxID=151549 RepID=A0A4C1WC85_EUMVA|nr:hypothetical protein EVAR_103046_1 [Eumeta japonica]
MTSFDTAEHAVADCDVRLAAMDTILGHMQRSSMLFRTSDTNRIAIRNAFRELCARAAEQIFKRVRGKGDGHSKDVRVL